MSKWENVALGDFGNFTNGINKDKNAFGKGVPFVNLLDIYGKESISSEPVGLVQVTENEIRNYDLQKGDILFARSSVKPEGVGQTCVVLRSFDRIVYSGFIIRYRQFEQKIWYQYAKYCFDNPVVRRSVLAKSTVSANTNINQESLKTIRIPLPPLPHQRKIARILTTVDNIIEKTEAAIAKYKAIKQGMMHDLFTRGIDVKTGKLRPRFEDAPHLYKETPLGWIPNEWEIERTKDISFRIWIGLVTTMTTHYVETGVKLIRNNNILDSIISGKDIINLDQHFAEQNRNRYLKTGDIVTVHTGDIGTSALITEEFNNSHGFATINTTANSKKILNIFLCNYYNSNIYKRRIQSYATGDGRSNFNLYDYVEIKIPYPENIKEQRFICDKIESIRNLIAKEEDYKYKLQKQKQGLMQDLLTGRKEVTPDPEDFQEIEN